MNSLTKASTKRSSAATAPVAPIIPVPALTFSLLLCLSHTPRFHLASFSPPLAARPDHRQQRQRWVRRRGGQQGFGGAEERPGEEKKKKERTELNLQVRLLGHLPVSPHCPLLYLSTCSVSLFLLCSSSLFPGVPQARVWFVMAFQRVSPHTTYPLPIPIPSISIRLSVYLYHTAFFFSFCFGVSPRCFSPNLSTAVMENDQGISGVECCPSFFFFFLAYCQICFS